MLNINHLSEDALLEVLSLVPALDLILNCRLVCSLWRSIIDSSTLWKTKCQQMGYISKDCKKIPHDWKKFYYICSKKSNLLKNTCAEESFKSWKIEQSGGQEWKIEDLPGDHGQDFPDEQVKKYFVTSYGLCKKSQLIDLKKMGYSAQLMDIVQPDIVIKDWFAPRRDCGSRYEILVRLLSNKKKKIMEFCPKPVFMEQWSEANWQQLYEICLTFRSWTVCGWDQFDMDMEIFSLQWHMGVKNMTHTFSNYGPGVRYIYFQHGGQDTQFWAGWYGVRVTNSSVTIEPEDLSA